MLLFSNQPSLKWAKEAFMQANRNITILDLPFFRLNIFNDHIAELTVSATVECGGVRYESLPILRLTIEDYWEGEVHTYDDCTHLIPYPKAIPAFRIYIDGWLRKYATTPPEVPEFVRKGIVSYLKDLHGFSDVKRLVRQAKSQVNMLNDQRKGAEQKARAVLAALEVTPDSDVLFEITGK